MRRFVELGLNFHILNQFPIPRPDKNCRYRKRVIELAGRLACPDDRFAEFANKINVKHGSLEEKAKNDMIYELDAVVAHLYELSENSFRTFMKLSTGGLQ